MDAAGLTAAGALSLSTSSCDTLMTTHQVQRKYAGNKRGNHNTTVGYNSNRGERIEDTTPLKVRGLSKVAWMYQQITLNSNQDCDYDSFLDIKHGASSSSTSSAVTTAATRCISSPNSSETDHRLSILDLTL